MFEIGNLIYLSTRERFTLNVKIYLLDYKRKKTKQKPRGGAGGGGGGKRRVSFVYCIVDKILFLLSELFIDESPYKYSCD